MRRYSLFILAGLLANVNVQAMPVWMMAVSMSETNTSIQEKRQATEAHITREECIVKHNLTATPPSAEYSIVRTAMGHTLRCVCDPDLQCTINKH
jgi:hypothetical protein